MISTQLQPLVNHLWQSTAVAAVAGLLTLALKNNRAHIRYCLWLAASLKFLIPFSLLLAVGNRFPLGAPAAAVQPTLSAMIGQAARPLAAPSQLALGTAAPAPGASWIPAAIFAVWAAGFFAVAVFWWARWRAVRKALSGASPVELPLQIPAMASPAFSEPGVFGVFHPVLLVPAGIFSRLAPPELEAILRHELCHLRRRDHLSAALHMLVEALFWFHPLVWWIGARLVEERERACDEAVLQLGSDPEVYAEGILKICELRLEAPSPCVAGVGGANLKKRITAIMTHREPLDLSFAKQVALGAATALAMLTPIVIGMAQTRPSAEPAAPLYFDAASVQVDRSYSSGSHSHHRGTQLEMTNVTLRDCLQQAYSIADNRILGPAWIDSERYDITAKAVADGEKDQHLLRLQSLLKDRFQMVLHSETRQAPVYELVVAKNGPKLKPEKAVPESWGINSDEAGRFTFTAVSMAQVVKWLGRQKRFGLDRPVIDKTGLTGFYSFNLTWSVEDAAASAPGATPGASLDQGAALMAAFSEELGLKLEPRKGPVEFLVVDHAEKVPTAN